MRKNKYFIKRKNTYLHETVIERTVLMGVGYVLALCSVLILFWLGVCIGHGVLNG